MQEVIMNQVNQNGNIAGVFNQSLNLSSNQISVP
jgi:hypothetical protein